MQQAPHSNIHTWRHVHILPVASPTVGTATISQYGVVALFAVSKKARADTQRGEGLEKGEREEEMPCSSAV